MNTPHSDPHKLARWQKLWHTLHAVRLAPLLTDAEIDRLLDVLPKRRAGESLAAWLERCGRGGARRFTPVAEFERMAAAGAETLQPLPDAPILSREENFRLTVTPIDGYLRVLVEAQGLSAFEYAGREVALALRDRESLLAELQLDEDGKGEAYVEDGEKTRQALVRLCLFRIEPADGE